MLNEEILDTMVRMAIEASRNAYLVQSKFPVGACALASDGTLYSGCIVENTVPQLSISAEQAALLKAITDGKRSFDAVAVVADTELPYVMSGSSCQFLAEFSVPEVVMANMQGVAENVPLRELLPYFERMKKNKRVKKHKEA